MQPTFNILLLLALSAALVSPASADSGCTNVMLTGDYSYYAAGLYPSVDKSGHLNLANSVLNNFVGVATFDGAGNMSSSFTWCSNGSCKKYRSTGTYSVNSDCSGKIKFGKGTDITPWTFAISNRGNQVYLIETDVANISGTATKQ